MDLHPGMWVYVDNATGRGWNKYLKVEVVDVFDTYVLCGRNHKSRYNLDQVVRVTHKDAPVWVEREE